MLFLERSFLFDDALAAWRAVTNRDLPFALRIYQRLADMGSDAAAWNAERIATALGADGGDWFKLQVAMHFEDAIGRLGEQKIRSGDVGSGRAMLVAAAEKESAAAFLLGWESETVTEAQKWFEKAVALNRAARLPVALAKAWMIIRKLPRTSVDWITQRRSDDVKFVRGAAMAAWRQLVIVALMALLWFLIRNRLNITVNGPYKGDD
jgi:hypothetical protein